MLNQPITDQERFDYAFNVLMLDEGGYSDDPDDPGGATKYGITQKDLNLYAKLLNIPENVKDLTLDNAKKFYKVLWWDKYHYGALNSLEIATKIFTLAVNVGSFSAAFILQYALRWGGYGIEDDGIIGPKTIAAANEMCLHGREEDLDNEIKEEASVYYQHITEENPKLYKFLKGWLKRAEE